jgi:CheY-like chemotaxis protein
MANFETIARTLYARKPRGTGKRRPREGASVLIVDDNAEVIASLRQILQDEYNVLACSSYAEVELCRAESIKVVLLDIKMAPKDGFAIFSLLRQRSQRVGIIFNTAYPGESMAAARLRDLDADGYLTKGEYSIEELKAAIERAMSHSSAPAGVG